MQLFRKESIPFLIILILSAAVLVLAGQYYIERQNLIISENTVKTFQYDQKVLNFTKLFITKVLKSDGEVSFDDRLQLENSVRDINDKTIFDQWQKFVNAKTALEAQIEVKNLLELLVNKIIF
jgi:hypothetical protein